MFGGSRFSSAPNGDSGSLNATSDVAETTIRQEATDAFLRFQETQPTLKKFSPGEERFPAHNDAPQSSHSPAVSELLDAPLSWKRRMVARFRSITTLTAAPHQASPFWSEVFRLAGEIPGAFPPALAQEMDKKRDNVRAASLRAAQHLISETVGRAFPELAAALRPTPLHVGTFTQTHVATLPNGGIVRLTLRNAQATLQAHEEWRSGVRRAQKFLTRAGDAPDAARKRLHLAAEHLYENLDCRRLAQAMETWASPEFGACALTPLPELTSETTFAVAESGQSGVETSALFGRSADERARIVAAMWKRFARHVFEKGLFHADGGTHHWRFTDEKCLYVGVDYVGRLTPEERIGWMKSLSSLLARDSAAAEQLSVLFPGTPISIVESRLRDLLSAPPAQATRLARALTECLPSQSLSPNGFALLRALAALERWSAALAPHYDPLSSFFVALQEMQAGQIISSALAAPGGIRQAAQEYFSLLRGSFKVGLEKFTGGKTVAAAGHLEADDAQVAPAPGLSSPLHATLSNTQKSPAPMQLPQPASHASLAKPVAFQVGLCVLVVLQWTNPHPFLGVPTPIGTLHADIALALVLCAAQTRTFFLRKR